MRIVLFALASLALGILVGCGGGAPAQPATLLGQWVEALPAPQPAWQEGDWARWPTRLLTIKDDGSFTYEENAPENWVKGTYSVVNNELHFSRVQRHGTVEALQNNVVNFAVLGDTLGMVEDTPDGDRVLQLTRVAPSLPPALAQEWLAARRLSADNVEVPLPASVRMTIADDDTVEQCSYLPSQSRFTVASGRVLQTTTGSLTLYVGASGAAPGQVDILGPYALQSGTLTTRLPNNERLCYVSRVAPDPRMAVDYSITANGNTSTLSLHPDGTYSRIDGGVTTTGAWHTYRDNYLCLTSATEQHTYTWDLWVQSSSRTLRLGEWVPLGDGTCHFMQTSWLHWDG